MLSHSGGELIIKALAENSRDCWAQNLSFGRSLAAFETKTLFVPIRVPSISFNGTFHVYTFNPPVVVTPWDISSLGPWDSLSIHLRAAGPHAGPKLQN